MNDGVDHLIVPLYVQPDPRWEIMYDFLTGRYSSSRLSFLTSYQSGTTLDLLFNYLRDVIIPYNRPSPDRELCRTTYVVGDSQVLSCAWHHVGRTQFKPVFWSGSRIADLLQFPIHHVANKSTVVSIGSLDCHASGSFREMNPESVTLHVLRFLDLFANADAICTVTPDLAEVAATGSVHPIYEFVNSIIRSESKAPVWDVANISHDTWLDTRHLPFNWVGYFTDGVARL